jgi:tRNA A37 methylthiotransferase MiaB
LRNAAKPIQQALRESRIGGTAWVLPEKLAKREGYTMCRAEDYLAVLVYSDQVTKGVWQKVSLKHLDGEYLVGDVV